MPKESKVKFMNNDLFRNKYRIQSARAPWHDYNNGCYFVTICTDKREHFFGEIYDNKIILSKLGKQATLLLQEIEKKYNDASVLSFVVMPNHIHLLISVKQQAKVKNKPQEPNRKIDINEKMKMIAEKRGRLSLIISKYKSSLTRFAIKNDIYFAWQDRFNDRIIRDYNEMIIVDNYIKNNISNWKDDEHYPNTL